MNIKQKSVFLLAGLVLLSSIIVVSAPAITPIKGNNTTLTALPAITPIKGNNTTLTALPAINTGNSTVLKPIVKKPTPIQQNGPGDSKISNNVKIISTSTYTAIDQFGVMYSANTFVPRVWLMNGGKYIGQLIFEPDGSKLPVDSKINGQINLYYHLADFKNIMDLLENSPTVSLLYVGSGNGNENGIYAAARNIGPSNIRIISPVYTYSNPTVAPKSVETTSASMGNTGGILGNNTTIQPKI